MLFWIILAVFGLACTAVTYKTLVGYGHFSVPTKVLTLLLLLLAWFGPAGIRLLREYDLLSPLTSAYISKTAYVLMGFALILIFVLLVRDFLWFSAYALSRHAIVSPADTQTLNRANLLTLIVVAMISAYGIFSALKTPAVETLEVTDSRILKDFRAVVASDLHIDPATPDSQINRIVQQINALKPDYVFLVGDIVDDVPDALKNKMSLLNKIEAQKVYLSLGNHEYYNAPIKWMIEYTNMGFEVLHNTGLALGETGVFLGGIPDFGSANVNYEKASYGSTSDQYKILLSHAPRAVEEMPEGLFDLQLSGHTHGGQIFPFNFFAKLFNTYLAGEYEHNGTKIFVTRGAGYWGPVMRLLAPSDIVLLEMKGQNDEQ